VATKKGLRSSGRGHSSGAPHEGVEAAVGQYAVEEDHRLGAEPDDVAGFRLPGADGLTAAASA
jgi:hypothetical protein